MLTEHSRLRECGCTPCARGWVLTGPQNQLSSLPILWSWERSVSGTLAVAPAARPAALSCHTQAPRPLPPVGLHTHDLHGQEGHAQRCALTLLTAGLRRTDYSPSSSYVNVCATGSASQRKQPQESFTPESRMGQTQHGVRPWHDSAAIRGPAVTCIQSVERTTLRVIPFTGACTETESRRWSAEKRDRAVETGGAGASCETNVLELERVITVRLYEQTDNH